MITKKRYPFAFVLCFLLLTCFFSPYLDHIYAQETNISCNMSWDNDHYIDQSFRQLYPNNEEVVCALYGEGLGDTTAYTQHRSEWDTTQCNVQNIHVLYTEQLPTTEIATNTIYVLTGTYTTITSNVNLATCSAIISQHTGGTTFFSTTQFPNAMIYAKSKKHVILDNITTDGIGSVGGTVHGKNKYGIVFWDSLNIAMHDIGTHNTIVGVFLDRTNNNVDISTSYLHNNKYGLYISRLSEHIYISDSFIYNNQYGLFTTKSNYIYLNNIQLYNNELVGMALSNTQYTTVNNVQVYNNGRGIYLDESSNNIFNTIQSYNNQRGRYFNNATNNILHTTQTYNNTYYGMQFSLGSVENFYYGPTVVFDNGIGNIYGNLDGTMANFSVGNGLESSLGWDTGILTTTDTISWDNITNPISNDGQYLLPRNIPWENMRGYQPTYNNKTTKQYSYGSGILLQKQPVEYLGNILSPEGGFTSTAYIGSNLSKVSGTAILQGLSVMVESQDQEVSHYSLFGNITTPILESPLNNDSTIVYENGISSPMVIAQLSTPGGYFATHFKASTGIFENTTCAPRWDNDNFLDETFRANDPTDSQIICALYGSGLEDITAYTQHRSGWNTAQCDIQNMSIIHTTSLGITNLLDNTIYVLDGIQSITTGTIYMGNCSAIVSKNESGTIFYSQSYIAQNGTLRFDSKQYSILDNITFQGTGGGPVPSHKANNYGIRIVSSQNNTLHAITMRKHTSYGIWVELSDNNALYTITSYNTIVGINIQESSYTTAKDIVVHDNTEGLMIHAGTYNTIETIRAYNNTQGGVKINHYLSTNNTINNLHSYNNQYGVWMIPHFGNEGGPSYNTINNAQIHNNTLGLYIHTGHANVINNVSLYNNNGYYCAVYLQNASANIMNNTHIYNNACGIFLENDSLDNYYYGTLSIYQNAGGTILQNISGIAAGQSTDYPGLDWEDGQLISTGILSWNSMSNPLNTDGNYFLPRIGSWDSIIGKKNRYINTTTNTYSYGADISTQIQPVSYVGQSFLPIGDFASDEYIGSPTKKMQATIEETLPIITNFISPYTITPISDTATQYMIFGDLLGVPYSDTIGTPFSFSLLPGDGQKRIIAQFFYPFATHIQHTILLDQTPPHAIITYSPDIDNWTAGPVTATIDSFNEEITNLNTDHHIFYTNGSFEFSFEDLAGNTTIITAVVDRIDGKSSPDNSLLPSETISSLETEKNDSNANENKDNFQEKLPQTEDMIRTINNIIYEILQSPKK